MILDIKHYVLTSLSKQIQMKEYLLKLPAEFWIQAALFDSPDL